MEDTHNYDGQGLKGALWTLAGTSIAGVAQRLVGGGLGGMVGTAANDAAILAMANKDAEIAQLKADAATDKKLVEVYTALAKNDKDVNSKVDDLKGRVLALETAAPLREQILGQRIDSVAMLAKSGIDTNSAAIASLAATVGQITKTIVPKTAVCPEPMARYNSWTAPTE